MRIETTLLPPASVLYEEIRRALLTKEDVRIVRDHFIYKKFLSWVSPAFPASDVGDAPRKALFISSMVILLNVSAY